jgi:hypothetical protein
MLTVQNCIPMPQAGRSSASIGSPFLWSVLTKRTQANDVTAGTFIQKHERSSQSNLHAYRRLPGTFSGLHRRLLSSLLSHYRVERNSTKRNSLGVTVVSPGSARRKDIRPSVGSSLLILRSRRSRKRGWKHSGAGRNRNAPYASRGNTIPVSS